MEAKSEQLRLAGGVRQFQQQRHPKQAVWSGRRAWVAQLVERVLGKDEVTGSIPVPGSRI